CEGYAGVGHWGFAAAIACPPHPPALPPPKPPPACGGGKGGGRRLEHLGVSKRDVVGQVFALGRKAERAAAAGAERVAAVDEGIEHDAEELVCQLERRLLRAGRRFAREQRERAAEIDAAEGADARECRRQGAAIVEERVERVGDVALVYAEGAGGRARSARRVRRAEYGQSAECGSEIEGRVGRGIAQRSGEAGGEIGGGESA